MLCTTTARGDLLAGTTPQVQTTARGTNTAITLTLDANIQRACEAIAAQNISKGCIIVMQVGSGQILASTSMPEFDPDDIAASIRADDTSLINRSLSAFSAGSVFKVVLAAAAYAQGLDWFTYDCTGSIQTAGKPSAVRWGGRTAPSTCAARWNKAVTVTLLRWASCWAGRQF